MKHESPEATKIQALNYLNQNILHHINMIESIKHNQAQIIQSDVHGVVMLDIPSETHMISCDTIADYERLLRNVDNMNECEVFQSWARGFVQDKYHLTHKDTYVQAAYLSEYPQVIQNCDLNVRILAPSEDYPHVEKFYPAHELSYVMSRLQANALFGGFINHQLVGFIGIHDEGSIGLLAVVEEHRRKGYGVKLMNFMIRYFLEHRKIPYSQISESNKPSILLHQKAGMQISKEHVEWLKRD